MNFQAFRYSEIVIATVITWLGVACGTASGKSGVSGRAGSTARFAIVGESLYTISGKEKTQSGLASKLGQFDTYPLVRRFDLSVPTQPRQISDTRIFEAAETLHTDGERLYIGAQSSMGIYAISETGEVGALSIVRHVRACDPVVTEGSTAYVTLHNAPTCQGNANLLKIIDIQRPSAPVEIASFPMNAPFGLAVQAGRAYICDGSAGLRIFDVQEPKQIKELPGVGEDICIDVILNENHLITTGFTGIGQYDASVSPPQKLSVIQVGEAAK